MTDKMTVHPVKQMPAGAFSVKKTLVALLSTCILVQPVNAADQEWWFDVEVILFERNVNAVNISEKFKQSRLEQSTSDVLDLLTPYLKPNLSYLRAGLPYCRVSKQLAVKRQYEVATTDVFSQSGDTISLAQTTDADNVSSSNLEQNTSGNLDQQKNIELVAEVYLARPPINVEFIEWQVPSELLCAYAEQIDPSFASASIIPDGSDVQPSHQIKRVPEIINGIEWQQKRGAFLLPTSNMHMSDLYKKIKRQRDITPILHLNWRQEVKFGRDKGHTFRLFAGENFAEQFDVNGLPLVDDTDNLFDSLSPPTDEFYIPEKELARLTPEQQQALLTRINGTGPKAVPENLFAKIATALADVTPITIEQTDSLTENQRVQQTAKPDSAILKELCQLDGGITVYLRNVGRIPYLHIDSNLDFRQPIFDPKKTQKIEGLSNDLSEQGAIAVNQLQQPSSSQPSSSQPNYLQPNYLQPNYLQPNYLQSVNFNQLRRVISKQVHYFDHPLFGMVVRINRYRWPEIQIDDVELVSQDN